jgi:HSP20 family protein
MYPIAQLINAALDPTPTRSRTWDTTERTPRTNILEGDKDYRLEMDLPGVRTEDLDISVEDDTLTVKAERSLEVPEGYQNRRCEMSSKVTWRRSFQLGSSVDVDNVSARLEHGILSVTLPKSEKSLPRRIEVK